MGARRAALGLALAGLVGVHPGCHVFDDLEDCKTDAECPSGLQCNPEEHFCEPPACETGDDCRAALGYGMRCNASGRCETTVLDSRCELEEPGPLIEVMAGRIALGALFRIGQDKERARADAVRLAVREINDLAGGFSASKLALIVCDMDSDDDVTNDIQESRELTRHLAADIGTPVIVGPSSSQNTQESAGLLMEQRLATAIISPAATSPNITSYNDRFDDEAHGLLWRTCPSDIAQASVLASQMNGDGRIHVVVLYQDDVYGNALRDEFVRAYAGEGVTTTTTALDVDGSNVSQRVQSAAADATGADAVLVVSGSAALMLQVVEAAATEAALATLPYYFTDGCKDRTAFFETPHSPEVETILRTSTGTVPANGSGTLFSLFREDLIDQFGVDPQQFSFVAHSYDAAFVGAYGLAYATRDGQRAPISGFRVADGMALLASGDGIEVGDGDFSRGVGALGGSDPGIDLVGTTGPLDFDAETGEAPGSIEVWRPNAAFDAFEAVTVIVP